MDSTWEDFERAAKALIRLVKVSYNKRPRKRWPSPSWPLSNTIPCGKANAGEGGGVLNQASLAEPIRSESSDRRDSDTETVSPKGMLRTV